MLTKPGKGLYYLATLLSHQFNLNTINDELIDIIERKAISTVYQKRLREEQIVFEITERQSIDDFEAFKMALLHYRRQGYLVAIDDAGAGYSSLQAIAELEPDFIKLDKSLIKGFEKNHVKAAIVEAFVTLTNKLGSKLIVEGIETLDEFRKAQQLKVHYAQGYFIARPANPCPVINPEIASIF